ncbi:WD40-repeat-containing domain protein [Tricladium varicosporioides]|nr:WD40-repeat-containing domain protein [Hymenoscyphus varicosporioides]
MYSLLSSSCIPPPDDSSPRPHEPAGTRRAVVTSMIVTTPHRIVVGLDDGCVYIYKYDKWSARGQTFCALEKAVWALGGWGDEWFVAGGLDGECGLWKFDDLDNKIPLHGHTATIRSLIVVSSNSIVSASRDTTLRIWNAGSGECEAVLEGHTKTVIQLAHSGDIIVSASYDGDGRVWSLAQKKCLHVLKGHQDQLYAVAFDGDTIVTGGLDKTARVWDAKSGACLAVLHGHTSLVSRLVILPSSIILTAGADGFLRRWLLENSTIEWVIKAHENSITSMQARGSSIVTGSSDGRVRMWDLKTGQLLEELAISDVVWKTGYAGDDVVAVLLKDDEVMLQIWRNGLDNEVNPSA